VVNVACWDSARGRGRKCCSAPAQSQSRCSLTSASEPCRRRQGRVPIERSGGRLPIRWKASLVGDPRERDEVVGARESCN